MRSTPQPIATASAKFDLSVGLVERRLADGTPGGIDGVLEYASDLFDAATVETLGRRLIRLLEAAVADAGPRARRAADPGARPSATPSCGAGTTPRSRFAAATLPALFAAQAARTPDAVAVVFEDRTLSYAALDAHANRLAHHLQSLGVGPETMVGLCVERSPEMVIGLLGILKAGGAYLPLDPNYPRERLAFMLADAGCPVLVTQSALLDRLPDDAARPARRAARRRLAGDRARSPHTAPPLDLDPRHPAYVIYTSGSTGTPKGRRRRARAALPIECWRWIRSLCATCASDRVPAAVIAQLRRLDCGDRFWPLIVRRHARAAGAMRSAIGACSGEPIAQHDVNC